MDPQQTKDMLLLGGLVVIFLLGWFLRGARQRPATITQRTLFDNATVRVVRSNEQCAYCDAGDTTPDGSVNLEFGEQTYEGSDRITVMMACWTCGRDWLDTYTLSGRSIRPQ